MVTTVRTTLELPVTVVDELRRRATAENRSVNDIAAEAARIGLQRLSQVPTAPPESP